MKKTITFVLVTIAAVSAVCYFNLTPAKEMSTLTMANIEALSDDAEDPMYKFKCEGNTCTCAVGENFTMHGHLTLIN